MNRDGALANYIGQLRLYSLAILVYAGVASLFVVPAVHRNHVDQTVKSQLFSYQKKSQKVVATAGLLSASGSPTSIAISRLSINLPVAAGYYNSVSRKWTLDSKHVFTDNYTNPNPSISTNQSRVTVLYGHDIPGILVKTSDLTFGDIMTINTQNGFVFKYYYDKSKVIAPTDTSILNEPNTGDPVMLVTCTGTWYQFRHAMYFKLLDVHKV